MSKPKVTITSVTMHVDPNSRKCMTIEGIVQPNISPTVEHRFSMELTDGWCEEIFKKYVAFVESIQPTVERFLHIE